MDRYQRLIEAVEEERKAEEAYYTSLSTNKSTQEKINSGILLSPVILISHHYTVGEYIELKLERTRNLNTPHKFKTGMGVRLYKIIDSKDRIEFQGNISFIRKHRVSIILKDSLVKKDLLSQLNGNLHLELIYDERPYKIMRETLKNLIKSNEEHLKDLREGVRSKGSLPYHDSSVFDFNSPQLNPSQNEALSNCLRSTQMSIIHGPPGTGKTTTLIGVVKALVKTEKKILVCAPSNNAVDLLARQIDAAGIPVLRIGNVTRIADSLTHLTINEKAREHQDWKHIKRVKIEAQEAQHQAQKFKRHFGQKERSERNMYYKEAKELRHWAKDLENKLIDNLISETKVICSTLIGVSHPTIEGLKFNTCIIDEASQALEPECWNAIMKCRRVILAGDHLQLAPTVKSDKAKGLGLDVTLLHRMTEYIKYTTLLNIQYRMHDSILSFSNKMFYNNALESDPFNKAWTLENDEHPLSLIDTSGAGFEENFNPKSKSRYNEGEFFILREHFLQLKDKYTEASIGIISPYSEQVKFLRII